MCNCNKNIDSGSRHYNGDSTSKNVSCSYSKDMLNKLIDVVNSQQKSIVISQLNIFDVSCSMFDNFISPLLEKHNIKDE
jgi:hypothetical protein